MRTTIYYDGREYVVARSADEVRAEIKAILDTGEPGWLRVNHGRGQLQVAELLIHGGVGVSLVDSSDPPESRADTTASS